MSEILPSQNLQTLHSIAQTVQWCVLFNFSIFFAIYKNTKYGFYVHSILGIICTLTTIGFILPFLIPFGLNCGFGQQGLVLEIHSWVGFVFVLSLLFQIFLGALTKLRQ